jgi:hypothetical protein
MYYYDFWEYSLEIYLFCYEECVLSTASLFWKYIITEKFKWSLFHSSESVFA